MKKYKERIHNGLKQRDFEVVQLYDSSVLPWFLEERWLVRRFFDGHELAVLFLTDKQWETGTKIVSEIQLTETEAQDNETQTIALLDLMKGDFELKIKVFWQELDAYLK